MSEGFLTTLFGGQPSSSEDLGPANPPSIGEADAPASDDSGNGDGGSHASGGSHVEPMNDSAE